MATINDLAQEVLDQIISDVRDPDSSFQPGKEHNDLVATSLVARAWRDASQAAMWRSITFYDEDEALKRFSKSPALGRFRIRELVLHTTPRGWRLGRSKPELAEKILTAVTITHSLDLSVIIRGNRFLDPAIFSAPGLAGLHTLTLQAGFSQDVITPIPTPSFSLTKLTLGCAHLNMGGVAGVLLNASRESLQFLGLHYSDEATAPVIEDLESSLPPILPSITCLDVRDLDFPLRPLFIHATALTRLVWEDVRDLKGMFEILPIPSTDGGIKSLEATHANPLEGAEAMNLLRLIVERGPPVLANLERLEFPKMSMDPFSKFLEEEPDGAKWLAALEARGIGVSHGA